MLAGRGLGADFPLYAASEPAGCSGKIGPALGDLRSLAR